MSRSISRRAFSFRSRRSSAASAPSPVGANPSSVENLATQPRTQLGSTPRLLAASTMEYPCSLTSLTAETLNSRVNFLRDMDAPLGRYYPAFWRAHYSWGSPDAMRYRCLCVAGILSLIMFRPLTCFADALYAWGDNSEGEFGDGNFGSATSSTSPVATLLTSGVTFIAGGEQHSLAVQNGAAYAWGDNNYGQVGVGNDTGPYITPQNPSSLSSGMTAVAGGADQSMAIMSGAVYSWGFNQYGEVGDGT